MEKIILVYDNDKNEQLAEILEILFPECSLEFIQRVSGNGPVLNKSKMNNGH